MIVLLLCSADDERGSGKTYCASILCAIKLLQGQRIMVFAQNYKALKENLFTEIAKRLDEMVGIKCYKWNRGEMTIKYGKSGICYGLSYENIDVCRGFTEISTCICDEIALAPKEIFQTVIPCMRGEGIIPRIYCLTTPKFTSWFNNYCLDKNLSIITAKTIDNKFITPEQYELMSDAFTNDALRRQELEGEIIAMAAANSLLSDTNYKITEHTDENTPETGNLYIGLDPSGYGKDLSVLTFRVGTWYKQVCYPTLTMSDCRNRIKKFLIDHPKLNLCEINIDVAYGTGYAETLSLEYDCVNVVNFMQSADDKSTYFNKRAEMYFRLVKNIKDEGMKITEDIEKELKATLFEFSPNGLLKLIKKDEIKMIIGRSPDRSDSLALTFFSDPSKFFTARVVDVELGNPED